MVILATLPMATMGAFIGLWITGSLFGFMPQLGLLALFGIVFNTGIIFIEFADILIGRKSAEKRNSETEISDAATASPSVSNEISTTIEPSGPICGLSRQEFRECLVSAGKMRMLPIFLTTATTICGLLPLALTRISHRFEIVGWIFL